MDNVLLSLTFTARLDKLSESNTSLTFPYDPIVDI